MVRQVINTGTTANDKTGDTLRASFNKINENFSELYANLDFITSQIPTDVSQLTDNLDLLPAPDGPILSVFMDSPEFVNVSGISGRKIPFNIISEDSTDSFDTATHEYVCQRTGWYSVAVSSSAVTPGTYIIELHSGTGNLGTQVILRLYSGPEQGVMNGASIIRLVQGTSYQIRIKLDGGGAGDIYSGQYTTYWMLAHLRD